MKTKNSTILRQEVLLTSISIASILKERGAPITGTYFLKADQENFDWSIEIMPNGDFHYSWRPRGGGTNF